MNLSMGSPGMLITSMEEHTFLDISIPLVGPAGARETAGKGDKKRGSDDADAGGGVYEIQLPFPENGELLPTFVRRIDDSSELRLPCEGDDADAGLQLELASSTRSRCLERVKVSSSSMTSATSLPFAFSLPTNSSPPDSHSNSPFRSPSRPQFPSRFLPPSGPKPPGPKTSNSNHPAPPHHLSPSPPPSPTTPSHAPPRLSSSPYASLPLHMPSPSSRTTQHPSSHPPWRGGCGRHRLTIPPRGRR